MMKKPVILIVGCLCVSPAFAQSGKWRGLRRMVGPVMERQVLEKLARSVPFTPLPTISQIHVENLPDQPRVWLNAPLPEGENRIMTAKIPVADSYVFPKESQRIYLPLVFNTQEQVAYRGMDLSNFEEVKNILQVGLETAKVSPPMPGMFFAGSVYKAALYATVPPREAITTIVQFKLPADLPVYEWIGNYYTTKDIPAEYIQHVMVFLEVEGKGNWYKATLENGELVLIWEPSRFFRRDKLVNHSFEIMFNPEQADPWNMQ